MTEYLLEAEAPAESHQLVVPPAIGDQAFAGPIELEAIRLENYSCCPMSEI